MSWVGPRTEPCEISTTMTLISDSFSSKMPYLLLTNNTQYDLMMCTR